MKKIIIAAMALLMFSATACQKDKSASTNNKKEGNPKMVALDGEGAYSHHNPIVYAYYNTYETERATFSVVIDRTVHLYDSLFAIRFDPDTVALAKSMLIEHLTTLGVIDVATGKFKDVEVVLPLLCADEPDSVLRRGLIDFTDSLLNNPNIERNNKTWAEYIGTLNVSPEAEMGRDGIVGTYLEANHLYGDVMYPMLGPGDNREGHLFAKADALGFRFGVRLAASLNMGGMSKQLMGELCAASFSSVYNLYQ